MATERGHDPHGHDSPSTGPIHHETTDINLDRFGKLVVGFIVMMGVIIAALFGVMQLLESRAASGQKPMASMAERPSDEPSAIRDEPNQMGGGRMPAGPSLLTNEPLNLRQYRTGHQERLASYGWVDRGNAVVHLPISRAIELTLERGLPVADPDALVAPADDTAVDEAPPAEAAEPVGEPAPVGVDDN